MNKVRSDAGEKAAAPCEGPDGSKKTGKQQVQAKGLASLRYILFLLKPCWKYGKMFTLVTLINSAVLVPLGSVAGTLLPKAAIDA
jgi:hypothetical protein